MKKKTCKLVILDEVNCSFIGLHPDHINFFHHTYGIHPPGYFFNPKFKLGHWDGKIYFFHKSGRTYVKLLDEILPKVISFGYNLQVDDRRESAPVFPPPIDEDFFSHVIKDGKPWKVRDYQIGLVNALLEHGGGVGIAGTGGGKAQSLNSKVLTPTGWRLMGELKVGDTVVTPRNTHARIVSVFPQGKKQLYRVTFHDGSSTLACGEHLWKVKFPTKLHNASTEDRIISTFDMIRFLERKRSNLHTSDNISIPLISPVDVGTSAALPISPYLLGVLLGNGTLDSNTIVLSSKDQHIIDRVEQECLKYECKVTRIQNSGCDYTILPSKNRLVTLLEELNLQCDSYNKFIPDIYKNAPVESRLELLRGLMDTAGTVDDHVMCSFTSTSEQLVKDVQQLVWSIGGMCSISHRTRAYTCFIEHTNQPLLFSLERKRSRCRDQYGDDKIELSRRLVDVREHSYEEAQCIMLDDHEHLYITDDYIVTHNTSMTAAISKSYELEAGLRSIIIVPDKNLTVQTKDEYAFFGLDVGEYSGTKKDLEHQHVVSTWQALKNNPDVITDFQVLIVDEAQGLKGNVITKLVNEYGKKIPYRFGVTGTLPKDEADALAVKIAVGTVQYEIPAHELQKRGVLSNLEIEIIQHDIDLMKQYKDFLTENPFPIPTYNQFKDSYFPDWNAEKDFLGRNKARLAWIANLIDEKRSEGKGNTLVLVNNLQMGRKLANIIPDSILLDKDTAMSDRQAVFKSFESKNDIVLIATAKLAGTGLNIPRIFNLFLLDIGKSFVRVIQSIGRGLRMAEDKKFLKVYDITSDLKYSKKHARQRITYYKEAKYPHKKKVIDFQKRLENANI